MNGLANVFDDDRVEMLTNASAERVEVVGGTTTGVHYRRDGREAFARADLVVLGANALFNPWLLGRSGLDHPELGVGLMEQSGMVVDVDLDGVDNFSGSTSITGHLYGKYAGPHRRERAAVLVESFNTPLRGLRMQRGRWRQKLELKVITEELRRPESVVDVTGERPATTWSGASPYAQRALARVEEDLAELLAALPVERMTVVAPSPTQSHVLGTAVMGNDPADSIVDAGGVHHRVRNLLVLGGSMFPTAAPANPTLTICALSLRAADRLQ
jgi:choline dehydrogenase-like flavoprotein